MRNARLLLKIALMLSLFPALVVGYLLAFLYWAGECGFISGYEYLERYEN